MPNTRTLKTDTIPRLALALTLSACLFTSSTLHAGTAEVAPPPAATITEAEAEPFLTGSLTVAWDSGFYCEGRNFLEEGGLVSTYLQVSAANGLGIWVWAADSYETDFAEVDVGLTYSLMLGDFDLGVGYTFGHDYQYDDDFHEANAWAYYRKYPWLVPGVRWKYGDFSGGSYVELELASEHTFLGNKLTVTPAVVLGLDYGYATEDVDGYNNLQLMLTASYALTETLSVAGYVAHTFALEDVKESGYGDDTFGGVSVTVAF